MGRKLYFEEIKEYINKENGCNLLTSKTEFLQQKEKLQKTSSYIPLLIECKCRQSFITEFARFKFSYKKQCNDCGYKITSSKKSKFGTVEEVAKIVNELSDCNLISQNYKSAKGALQFKCKCGEFFKSTLDHFIYRNKRQCNECGGKIRSEKRKIPYLNVKQFIEAESKTGCKLITAEDNYNGVKGKVVLACKCNKKFNTTFENFKLGKVRCKECSNESIAIKKSTDRSTYLKKIEEKNPNWYGKLLIRNYKNTTSEIICKCKECNYEWEPLARHLYYHGCPACGIRSRSKEYHHNWKGGISNIGEYLRSKISIWKKDSIANSQFRCVITGKEFDTIHHLYGFDMILKEVFEELNMDIRYKISDYSEEELAAISSMCNKIHSRYPLGVCLTKEVHMLFHNEYGYGNNTPEQFDDFKERCLNGQYNNYLEQNEYIS